MHVGVSFTNFHLGYFAKHLSHPILLLIGCSYLMSYKVSLFHQNVYFKLASLKGYTPLFLLYFNFLINFCYDVLLAWICPSSESCINS